MGFDEAYAYTKTFEGGYVHDPTDSGGETFRGISRKNWPRWAGWALIDAAKAAGAKTAGRIDDKFADSPAMEQAVTAFYRVNFWAPIEALRLPDRLSGKLFDAGVNMGTGGAAKLLQTAINARTPRANLAADGAIGPRTLAALGAILAGPNGEAQVLAAFCSAQANRYRAIVQAKPSQGKFLNGWLKRAAWVPA
jgi:lysozyme family protein